MKCGMDMLVESLREEKCCTICESGRGGGRGQRAHTRGRRARRAQGGRARRATGGGGDEQGRVLSRPGGGGRKAPQARRGEARPAGARARPAVARWGAPGAHPQYHNHILFVFSLVEHLRLRAGGLARAGAARANRTPAEPIQSLCSRKLTKGAARFRCGVPHQISGRAAPQRAPRRIIWMGAARTVGERAPCNSI